MQAEIEESAYAAARGVEEGRSVVVGVNRFRDDGEQERMPVLQVDPEVERDQVKRLAVLRAERNENAVAEALDAVRHTAEGGGNLLYPMKAALAAPATLGEVSAVLREVFGSYRPGR